MKKETLAFVLIFLIGAGIFLYPFIANRIAVWMQSGVIDEYDTSLEDTGDAKIERAREEAYAYNRTLSEVSVSDPFSSSGSQFLPDSYTGVLNIDGSGVMGYIEIPVIDVKLPIYHGTDSAVLARGAGHIEGTYLPVGGEGAHAVLCAHRGLPSAELFSRLDELETGDVFYISVLDEVHAYEVKEIFQVLPEEISPYFLPEEGKDLVTLMTCTPYGVNTHRLLVRGERTEYVPREKEETDDADNGGLLLLFSGIAALVLLAAGGIVWTRKRRGRCG